MNNKVIPFSLLSEEEMFDALGAVGERYGIRCDSSSFPNFFGILDEDRSYALGCNYIANYMMEHPGFEESSMKEGVPSLPKDLGDYFFRCINGGVSLVSDKLVSDRDDGVLSEEDDCVIPGMCSLSLLYRYGCAVSTYFTDTPACLVFLLQDMVGKEALWKNLPALVEEYKRCCLRLLKQMNPPQGESWTYYSRVVSLTMTLVRYGILLYRTQYGGVSDGDSSFWDSWDTYMPSDADV